MTRTTYQRLLLGCAVGVLSGATAWAAPFSVRRGESSSEVRGKAPKAVVVSSPFDDDGGSLKDGELRYYTVSSDSGVPTAISVHKNLAKESVRIGFDDGQALSGLADSSLSTVHAKPATAMADGVSTVTLTIVPRDADGTPLGKGQSIALDTLSLWPASVVGSVVDNSNGSYSVRLASSIPGSGNVAISVEGTWLNNQAAFEFTDPGSISLRDQAIDRLENLGSGNGPYQELMDRLATSAVSDELKFGFKDLGMALDDLDKGMDSKALSKRLADTLTDLDDARAQINGQDREDVELLMDRLAETARMIAVHHIAQAEASCGVCSAGSPGSVCDAREELGAGDEKLAQQSPDHTDTVKKFADAIEKASQGCR